MGFGGREHRCRDYARPGRREPSIVQAQRPGCLGQLPDPRSAPQLVAASFICVGVSGSLCGAGAGGGVAGELGGWEAGVPAG